MGVLGLAVGWLTADFLRAGAFLEDASLRPALVVLCTVGGVCVGRVLRAWAMRPLEWVLARMAVLVCAAGILCGLGVGAVVYLSTCACGAHGLLSSAVPGSSWAIEGFITALTVLPAFAAVTAAVWRIGRARPESLVGSAEARAPWLMLAASIATGALAALPNWHDARGEALPWSVQVSLAISAGALANACALLALDLRAWRRARALLASAPEMRRSTGPGGPRPSVFVDVGMFDVEYEIAKPSPTAYRGTDDVRLLVRGHPAAAHAALGAIVRQGGAVVGVATLCLMAAMQLPGAHLLARVGMAGPAHAAHATGLAECDLYLLELEHCLADDPARPEIMRMVRDSFRERAATPGAGAVADSCRSSLMMLGGQCR